MKTLNMGKISLCVTAVLLLLLSSVYGRRINCEIRVFRVLDCSLGNNKHGCQEYTPNHVDGQDSNGSFLESLMLQTDR